MSKNNELHSSMTVCFKNTRLINNKLYLFKADKKTSAVAVIKNLLYDTSDMLEITEAVDHIEDIASDECFSPDVELEVKISGTFSAGCKGSRFEPSEPDGIDDLCFYISLNKEEISLDGYVDVKYQNKAIELLFESGRD